MKDYKLSEYEAWLKGKGHYNAEATIVNFRMFMTNTRNPESVSSDNGGAGGPARTTNSPNNGCDTETKSN